jgi:hypothetical protein
MVMKKSPSLLGEAASLAQKAPTGIHIQKNTVVLMAVLLPLIEAALALKALWGDRAAS